VPSQLPILAALTFVVCASGCSLLLDFNQCETDADCSEGTSCIGGICDSETTAGVSGVIDTDTEWSGDVRLTGPTYVVDSTLTIRRGTIVRGDEGSALIIARGSQIRAVGDDLEPIVFTSSKPEGERRPGDWGGVVIAGDAPVNEPDARLEFLDADDPYAGYGGENPDGTCGIMQYTRVEWAGFAVANDSEFNGLTLAGCGSGTTLDHVQIHYGNDDGLELFGGNVEINNILITSPEDDALDWDRGWTGRGQFIAIVMGEASENGIEADNWEDDNDALPRSNPLLFNLTILGSKTAEGSQRAAVLRRGTGATIGNAIFMNLANFGIDVRDEASAAQFTEPELMTPAPSAIRNSLFFNIGMSGEDWFEDESTPDSDDDGGFDEAAVFGAESLGNIFGIDPGLTAPDNVISGAALVPNTSTSIVMDAAATPPQELSNDTAAFLGAFEPGREPWTTGWTNFEPPAE
jgi:hypothetical protein